jgi:hypothetical protein
MVKPSKKNCRATVPKIRQKLNLLDINCRTIERCLTKAGLHGRRQVKKPFTSKKLVFCDSTLQESTLHEHLKNGKEYSDESKFNLYSDDGKGYKKKNTYGVTTNGTQQHQSSLGVTILLCGGVFLGMD